MKTVGIQIGSLPLIIVFESLLPIFLLIAAGQFLKRISLIPDEHWSSLERISYFVLLAPLLILSLYRTDFDQFSFGGTVATFLVAIVILLVVGLVVRRPVNAILGTNDPSYSSIYQGITRWNAFIALAIVEKLYGASGLAIVIIGMTVMVLPLNIANVLAVAWLGDKNADRPSITGQFLANPIIVGCIIGLGLKFSSLEIYTPLENTLELLSRATLPVGLLLVGAGLRLRLPRSAFSGAVFSSIVRLVLAPIMYFALATWFGLTGKELIVVVLCGAVPTAMTGYLLAKQMGGDAPLMAGIVTLQVLVSFFTIPLVILLTQHFSGL